VEANDINGKMLGFEQLLQVIENGPITCAEAMLEYIKQEVFAFTGGAEQHDDMTIMVVKI
jgi:serine phosphatase RsbU (regulator of sigma subunit)